MTLKQKLLLEELPKVNNKLSVAAKNVGYSDSYATSGIYQDIRKPTNALKEYFNENTVKRDIKRIKKLTLKAKDYTNALRATELETKILGMITDKQEVTEVNKLDNQFSLDRLSRIKIEDKEVKPASEN